MDKKVSVIIPCYNQGKYVSDAIHSVLEQTYNNIEIICVNDASTDNSSEVIKSFADKYNNILFLENQENQGVVCARNVAIESSHGEYILPLDADDIIEPTYVEKAVKVLDDNPNIGIVYCKARFFGNKKKFWNLPVFDRSNILYNNCIFCSALFRKADFIKIGMYKNYMQYGYEDYDLWLSFIEHGFDVYRIDEILFNYRQYNEDSRSTVCSKNQNSVWKALIKNHIDLYLEDGQFFDKFHLNIKEMNKIYAKYKKYKYLFNIFLSTTIAEIVVIILFIVLIIWRFNG